MPITIPSFLEHLPTFGGFPVPFTVVWIDGRPDFRVIDREKQVLCCRERLCAICGRKMFRYFFIGGPKSMENKLFTDGPMHLSCAKFSASTCPFLTGKRTNASSRALPLTGEHVIVTNQNVETRRPDQMAIREAKEYVAGIVDRSFLYQVKKWKSAPILF